MGAGILALLAGSATAQADSCQGTISNNADTIVCQADGNADNTPLATGDGDDGITINSGTFASGIDGQWRNDTFSMNGGYIRYLDGRGGEDIFYLNGGIIDGIAGLAVLAGDDADTITLDGAQVLGTIRGENGNDIFYLLSGSATSVEGDDNFGATGRDLIVLNGANIGAIAGQGDNDTIDLLSGTVDFVFGNEGNDQITLNGASLGVDAGFGLINGDEGDDTIDLRSGTVLQNAGVGGVSGGDGNDLITLDGATIEGSIFGNADNDGIYLRSGAVSIVDGGDGNDGIYVYSTFDLTNVTTLSGGDDATSGDGFFDVLHLMGQTVETSDIPVFENFERINLEQSTKITVSEPTFTFDTEVFDIDVTSSLLLTNGGGAGAYAITGMLVNRGLVDLSDGFAGDALAIGGDFVSAVADSRWTPRSTQQPFRTGLPLGATSLALPPESSINDVGDGTGSATPIPVIFVTGATAPGDFALDSGVVTAGLFDYSLNLSGTYLAA